jgi:hypothetical protein
MEKTKIPTQGNLKKDDPRIPGRVRLLRRLIRNGLDRSAVPTAVRMVDLLDERRR